MSLAAALGWKYDNAPGIKTVDNVLVDWPEELGVAPDETEQAAIIAEYEYYLENPTPLEVEPIRIGCALKITTEDGAVSSIAGSFRIAAVMLFDTGVFFAIFNRNLGGTQPFVIPNNGVSVSISEWGGDYAMIEVRDHAGGSLITPSSFGFSLYDF